MALSTYQWRPPDTGEAAAAWLRGQALGQQEREFSARQQAVAQQFAQRQQEFAVQQQNRQQQLAIQQKTQAEQLARQMRADAATSRRLSIAEGRQRALDTQRGLDNAPYRAPGGGGRYSPRSDVAQALAGGSEPALPTGGASNLVAANHYMQVPIQPGISAKAASEEVGAAEFAISRALGIVNGADPMMAGYLIPADDGKVRVDKNTMQAANTGAAPVFNADTGAKVDFQSFRTAEGSVFATVPDGKGGLSPADPNDRTDSGVPGFDPNRGAWGANIKDPNLKGVALTPRELAMAGVDLDNPSNHVVEVIKDGRVFTYPIVDKLGKEGRIDFTGPAYKELGGPQNRNGGTIPGVQYRIVRRDGVEAPQSGVSRAVAQAQQEAEAIGIPAKQAPTYISRRVSELSKPGAGAKPPTTRNMVDNTTKQYNVRTGQWETIATKPEKPPKDDSRQQASSYLAERGQALSEVNNAQNDLDAFFKEQGSYTPPQLPWEGKDGEGKTIYHQLNAAGDKTIIDKETYDAALGKWQKWDGLRQKVARGEAKAAEMEAKVQEARKAAPQSAQAATPAPTSTEAATARRAENRTALDDLKKEVEALRKDAGGGKVYANEAEARAAGHKTGEIVLVMNPKTGQPGKYRLD